jgi:DNA polymerase-1
MPTLHLIDGSGYVFRAYHALPPLSTSKGVPTGAVRGVASMVLKDLREQKPTHLAFCMDLDAKGKRLAIYPEYKAHRPPPPEDLQVQFALVKDAIRSLNLPLLELSGYEADDIIATLAKEAQAKGFEVVVVSGDKDLMQLVDDGKCRFYDGMKDKWFDNAAVTEKWGVPPKLVGDLLALTGDSVDNVPGVPGVGEKTAAALLKEFGNLDNVIAHAAEIKKPKLRESMLANIEQVRLSRRLVELDEHTPIGVTVEDLALKPVDAEHARRVFSELEMYTLLKDLPSAPVAAPTTLHVETVIVRDASALDQLAQALESADRVAVRLLLSEESALRGQIVGLGFFVNERAFYVPVGLGGLGKAVLSEAQVLQRLRPIFEATRPLKDGHALKETATALRSRGVALNGIGIDIEIASFLSNAARREHALADLCREQLNVELPSPPQDSRKRSILAQVLPEEVAPIAGAAVQGIARLVPLLEAELDRCGARRLYETVERPIIPVLAQMEVAGIRVDVDAMRSQAHAIEQELARQLAAIQEAAGTAFNVNAPAQLAEVLFERLKLPVIKKGRTGPSTDAEVLEKLADQHPLPRMVLDYRTISKLKSTYLDTLPELVAADGRVHTTFHQLGAATGRLSSNDPNLQNIPIRTEVGRRIRAAFVADAGNLLVSADYSQIELRILAHMAQDAALIDSFSRGEDVHTRTAAEIYGVTPIEVQAEQRRVAKMINYAIAYGLSPYGLSTRLDIPREEAQRVIKAYFERYAGVKKWLDETIATSRRTGYVETILGRRRQLADLTAKNPMLRQAAERAAVNAPIQGTAADIVKVAMLAVDKALERDLPQARMLLQVHDELLFEVPEARVEELEGLVKPLMEGALKLSVPVVVDIGHGRSWDEAH